MESDLSSFVKQRHNFREALFLIKQKKKTRAASFTLSSFCRFDYLSVLDS